MAMAIGSAPTSRPSDRQPARRPSLRQRLAGAFVALAVLASLLQATFVWLISYRNEEQLIDRVAQEQIRRSIAMYWQDPALAQPNTPDMRLYVVPDGDLAEDAYRVIRDALRATRKVGIGQLVLRGRESIVALKPCGAGLMLETLRFADEVQNAAPFFADIGQGKSEAELLELAETLIEKKVAPFDPEKFKDQYTEALRDVIEAKAKKKKPVEVEDEEAPRGGAEIIDLVEALKRSVRGGGASGGAKAGAKASRKAPSRRRKAG